MVFIMNAKDLIEKLRRARPKLALYLENTRKRENEYIIYNLKDIDQKVYHTFKAKGFFYAIQYANEWAKNNHAVITGTTLFDCKDYINRTIEYSCGCCKND